MSDGEDDYRDAEAEAVTEADDDEAEDGLHVPDEDPADSDADREVDPTEELAESFPVEPLVRVLGADGMPETVTGDDPGHVPPLRRETFCCMADTRSFCLRGLWGEVIASFEPHEVERAPGGAYRVKMALALERASFAIKRRLQEHEADMRDHAALYADRTYAAEAALADILRAADQRVGHGNDIFRLKAQRIATPEFLEVDPIRPQCQYLGRQLMQAKDLPRGTGGLKGQIRLAVCTARRTLTGAFMSVRDTEVFGCDLRSPRDPETEALIDEFDEKKLEQSAKREYTKMFLEPQNQTMEARDAE